MAEGAKTILVVDDDPDTLTYLTTVLEDNGYATLSAKDGAEAMKMVQESPPALVSLDISMPEESGLKVYRTLKQDDNLKGIPIIMVTGISKDFERFISTRSQVPPPEGFLSKPIDRDVILKLAKSLTEA